MATATSRTYRGSIDPGRVEQRAVTVETADGTVLPLDHRVRHSPTGLSWGYLGSGPADLALSILWDFLGHEPDPACYQAFKAEVIARLPSNEDFAIPSASVELWLESWQARTSQEPEEPTPAPDATGRQHPGPSSKE
jgi:hypothetical protein